jgi:hypothetical protein
MPGEPASVCFETPTQALLLLPPDWSAQVPFYEYALDLILDVETPRNSGLSEEQQVRRCRFTGGSQAAAVGRAVGCGGTGDWGGGRSSGPVKGGVPRALAAARRWAAGRRGGVVF